MASAADGDPGLKFSTLLNDARSRGLTEEQRERLRQEQRLVAELDEKIIASLALAEKIRNMEGYLDKLQGDMTQLDQKIQSTRNGAAAVAAACFAGSSVRRSCRWQPRRRPRARLRTTRSHGSTHCSQRAAGLVGWLWWRRRQPDGDSYAGPSDGAAEIGENGSGNTDSAGANDHRFTGVAARPRPPNRCRSNWTITTNTTRASA